MSAILIPGAFLVLAGIFLCRPGNGLGSSILKAALSVYLIVWASTELLSLASAITWGNLLIFWSVVLVACLTTLIYTWRSSRARCRLRRKLPLWRKGLCVGRETAIYTFIVGLVLLLSGFMASKSFAYDADSLSYHMSRVANWINSGDVDFYTTVNQRQNFYAPGSEYLMLHLQLLAGSDRVAMVPQFASMLLCLLLVAMVAAELGVGRRGRVFCVTCASTIPILIGQSHCQQNDLIAGALMLSFVWFLLQLGKRPGWGHACWLGITFGLALMTKGTAFIFCAGVGLPLGIWAFLSAGRRRRLWGKMAAYLAVAMLMGLLIKTPFLARCSFEGQTFLRNEFTSELRPARYGLDILGANALRNAAVHLGLPDSEWNAAIVEWVKDKTGDQAGNEESLFRGRPFMMHPSISCFYSTNPLHLALALLAWLLVPFLSKCSFPRTTAYHIGTLFCAVMFNLCLKWQYWGIRLQLPWLLMMIPLLGLLVSRSRLPGRLRVSMRVLICFALMIGALPALLCDIDLPLWAGKKPPLMFRDDSSVRFQSSKPRVQQDHAYYKVAHYLAEFEPAEVGLCLPKGNGCFDYNWWVVFGIHARPGLPKLRHVGPDAWPEVIDVPEWVIARGRAQQAAIKEMGYAKAFDSGGVRVYRRRTGENEQE